MDIEFDRASFRYGRRQPFVLADFSMSVGPGRTILLGPNGAGKSTVLSIAASVFSLSRGRVSVGGVCPDGRRARAGYRRMVAWMPQTIRPAAGLTVHEQVALHGWLAGLGKMQAWDDALDALDRVALGDLADRRAATLSGGQRARMGLAQALVHDAEVLLLDEPTAALDPDQKDVFAALLNDVSQGRTVVVSTHDVSDLQASYDRVIVLDQGRVKFQGSVTDFLHPDGVALSPVQAYRTAMGGR